MSYAAIVVSFTLVNNLLFTYFLGLCILMDASRSLRSGLTLGLTLTLMLTVSTGVGSAAYQLLLVPLRLQFLRILVFTAIALGVGRLLNAATERFSAPLHQLLQPNAPLLTAQTVMLGMVLITVRHDFGVIESLVAGVSAGVGLLIVFGLMAAIREQLDREWIPRPFRGAPIALISAGLLAMAFLAFDSALLVNLFN